MVFLPPTSEFPPDPEPLDRDSLNSNYRELRSCYASSMRSRAQHRRLATKAKDETTELRERLTALASRDLPNRKEIYEILEIATSIVEDMEDVGDGLVNGYGLYKTGRRGFQGGGYIGDLIQAVIHFINRWGRTKDRLGDLKKKQQDLRDRSNGLLPPPPSEDPNGDGKGQPPGLKGASDADPSQPSGSQPVDPPSDRPQSSQPPGDDGDKPQGDNGHG